MEPASVIKSNLTPSKLVGFVVVALVVFAVLDLAGLTPWILYPVSNLKAKFSKSA